MAAMTIEEFEARQTEIKGRLAELDAEFAGQAFPDDAKSEWNTLNEERDANDKLIVELRARKDRVAELADKPGNREDEPRFHTNRPGVVRDGDIFDLSTVRSTAGSPDEMTRELRERGMRAIELAQFPQTERQQAQGHVQRLLETRDTEDGQLARLILTTGSPQYKRAFGKYLSGKYLSGDETRALSLTGSAGGFAVPFELDPTIIPTSNLALNPFRAISRVEQITVDEWRGVSSAGITAAYAAEATAATDNAPTLAQPTISTEKAQAFIPYSIEVGMDWNGLQDQMARLLQDAKDELEATKFTLGSGTNEPQGVITGATTVYTAADTDSLVVADIYGLEGALGARFRPRAVFVMNGGIANRIRQFDTQGGASIWVDNIGQGLLSNDVPTNAGLQARLLGHPAYESSAMSSAMTTGQLIGVFGDFNYYVIVDRIGLTVETIPHLFDVTNNRPTGQRGLYAYWRNGAGVISPLAFRVLKLA